MLPAAQESNRQMADLKYGQPLPSSQVGHPGGVELPLAFVSPSWAPNRAGASCSPSGQKAQPAPKVARLLSRHRASAHSQGKAFSKQADPAAALLLLLRNTNSGNWRLSWAGLSSCPGGGQQLPPTACHCCCPAQGKGAPLATGAREPLSFSRVFKAPSPWQ